MSRNFNEWLSKFKTSISDYTYYVDFERIYKNVDKVKVELSPYDLSRGRITWRAK